MKITTTILAPVLALLFFSTGCNQDAKKELNKAAANFQEANQEVGQAAKDEDSVSRKKISADWKHFKQRSDSTLNVLNRDMTDIKSKIAKADEKEQKRLNTDLNEAGSKLNKLKEKLKREDQEFKREINTLNAESTARNESFKREFNHDSHELATALKDLFKNNVK